MSLPRRSQVNPNSNTTMTPGRWSSNNKILNGGNRKTHLRNPNFDDCETKILITLWGDVNVQQCLKTYKKPEVLLAISEQMTKQGYNRSVEEISTRIKNLKCIYNRVTKSMEKGTPATWKYYDMLHSILSRETSQSQPNSPGCSVTTPSLRSSIASSNDQDRNSPPQRDRETISPGQESPMVPEGTSTPEDASDLSTALADQIVIKTEPATPKKQSINPEISNTLALLDQKEKLTLLSSINNNSVSIFKKVPIETGKLDDTAAEAALTTEEAMMVETDDILDLSLNNRNPSNAANDADKNARNLTINQNKIVSRRSQTQNKKTLHFNPITQTPRKTVAKALTTTALSSSAANQPLQTLQNVGSATEQQIQPDSYRLILFPRNQPANEAVSKDAATREIKPMLEWKLCRPSTSGITKPNLQSSHKNTNDLNRNSANSKQEVAESADICHALHRIANAQHELISLGHQNLKIQKQLLKNDRMNTPKFLKTLNDIADKFQNIFNAKP